MQIDCLDHGFVKVLNISGPVRRTCIADNGLVEMRNFDADSTDIARAARICFNNFEKERTREKDLGLVDYLIRNHHTSPVEMIEVWLEMKLPIFVARQFIRHRTATVNEVSGRYAILPEEWYIPETVGGKSSSNKQGQDDNLDIKVQKSFKQALDLNCKAAYNCYIHYLKDGVAPEHARLLLHVNHYTHWIWKQNLHNLFHFLALRLHEHAQVEARVYAEAIYTLMKEALPEVMEMFDKYRRL
jgi:thymidylate synthase (FAD)